MSIGRQDQITGEGSLLKVVNAQEAARKDHEAAVEVTSDANKVAAPIEGGMAEVNVNAAKVAMEQLKVDKAAGA